MSYGLVICSFCKREVHQDGTKDATTGRHAWKHCNTGSWICHDAKAIHPQSRDEIMAEFCGADDFDGKFKPYRPMGASHDRR